MKNQSLNFIARPCAGFLLFSLVIASCSTEPVAPLNQPVSEVILTHHVFRQQEQKFSTLSSLQTFVVNNESSQMLGSITLSDSMQNFNIIVGPYEIDTADLDFTTTSVIINSRVCTYPDSAIIGLPSGAKVEAGWPNPNMIAIIDYATQD